MIKISVLFLWGLRNKLDHFQTSPISVFLPFVFTLESSILFQIWGNEKIQWKFHMSDYDRDFAVLKI